MINYSILTAESLADGLRELERDMPRQVYRRIARDIIPPLERELDRILGTPPPARTANSPEFVYSFDPVKNRKAQIFMAINYPDGYTRTDEMVEAWETAIYLTNAIIAIDIYNESEGASYVFGSDQYDQSPGHRLTGWPRVAEASVEIGVRLENAILDEFDDMIGEYI